MNDETRGQIIIEGYRSIANNISRLTVVISQGLTNHQTHEWMKGDKRVVSTAESITTDKQIADLITELGVTIASKSVTKVECA